MDSEAWQSPQPACPDLPGRPQAAVTGRAGQEGDTRAGVRTGLWARAVECPGREEEAGSGKDVPRPSWRAAANSPVGRLSPSFCQVTLGRGTPEASQSSSTSSPARTRATLGSGFTTGDAAEAQDRGSWGH